MIYNRLSFVDKYSDTNSVNKLHKIKQVNR